MTTGTSARQRSLAASLVTLPSRRPRTVITLAVLITAVLAVFAGQAVRENEVSTSGPRAEALEQVEARFGDPVSTLQIVVTGDSDLHSDLHSDLGDRAARAIREAIVSSDVAGTLVDGRRPPPIVTWRDGTDAAGELPADVRELLDGLVSDDSSAALVLVFQDSSGLSEEQARMQQARLADVVDAAGLPDGVSAEPFSFALLMGGDNDVGGHIAVLFATALGAILVALSLVYWRRPAQGRTAAMIRRTIADVGLTLAVIIMAVIWMQGLGVLLGPDYAGITGYFSPSSQIVPILIVGLGVDFAIHLLRRYRSELGRHRDVAAAGRRALSRVGVALALGTAATAAGFLTTMASPLDFLSMLGLLAALGIVAAFLLTVTFLPAARTLLDRRTAAPCPLPDAATHGRGQTRRGPGLARLAWPAERAPIATVALAIALTAGGVAGFTQLDSEFDVTDFVPRDEPMLNTFDTLEQEFSGGFDAELDILLTGDLLTTGSHALLTEATAQITTLDELDIGAGGITSPDTVLAGALADSRFRDDLLALGAETGGGLQARADVARLYRYLAEHVPAGSDVIDTDSAVPAARITIDAQVPAGRAAAVEAELDTILAGFDDVGVVATATSPELVRAQLTRDIADSQLLSMVIALTAATALLTVYFRCAKRQAVLGLLTMAPVALVVTSTLGAMALSGIPLNPVTATLAALSIGIGVPFTIHITNRYLEERTLTRCRASALRRTLDSTGAALTASAITTAIGFGVLTLSTLLPFRQLGFVTLFAIGSSLIAAILVLPSLLTLWERAQDRRDTRERPGRMLRGVGRERCRPRISTTSWRVA